MIPVEVLSEDGNKPLTPEVLAESLEECAYEADHVPSSHELRGAVLHLGGGDSWNECLRHGMPAPVTVRDLCAWLVKAGWLSETQIPDRYK
jgi:hypothetical protein